MMTRRITGLLLILLLCFGSLGIHALADPEATPSEASGFEQLGNQTLNNDTNLSGNQTLNNDANLSGNQTLNNDTNLIGNQTLNNDTNLSGNQALNNDTNLNGNQTPNNDTNLSGNQALNNDSNLSGNQTLNNDANLSGNQTLNNDANLIGNQTLNNDANLIGNQTLNNDANLSGNQTLNNDANLSGNQTLNNDTNLIGNQQLNSTSTLSDTQILKSGGILLSPSLPLKGPGTETDAIKELYINNTNDGNLEGYVTITGDKGVILELWKGTALKGSRSLNKDAGTFSFSGLDDGTYEIQIRFSDSSTPVITKSNIIIDNTKKASPITGTAVGGIGQVTATVTSASPKEIKVEVISGGTTKKEGTISSGIGSITLTGLEKGTYVVKMSYTDTSSGVSPLEINNVIVTDTSTTIKFTSVVGGEEKLTVSGQGAAGAPIILSLTPGGYDTTVTPGTDGLFSKTIPCAAGTYTAVHAQYQGNPGSKVDLAGSWTVTGSSVKPELTIDTIYDDELIVTASTKPGITVCLDAYDYSQTLTSSSDGTLKYTLYHTYSAGTNFTFTVYYGSLDQYSYKVTKTVVAASTYRTLSIGDTGSDVYDLTKRLGLLKYPISAQSLYDSSVANAVRLFQERNGLIVTGVADETTQKLAFSSGAIPYDSHYIITLVRGDRGPLVSALQSRLKELGYYTIRVDGIFGSGTQRAVRNFQAKNGLSVTGIADVTMQNVLYSSSAIPSGGYTPIYYTTLKRSSRYQAGVVPLQSRLNALGYAAGSADGYFGSRTYRAVRNFQSRNGLPVTGIADVTTQQVLYSSSAIPAGSSVTPVPSSSGYRLLYWGCKGDSVRRLQQALKNLGYNQIKYVDGIYGKQTYDAVCAFQRNNGLSVDGIAGRMTQNRLYGTNY